MDFTGHLLDFKRKLPMEQFICHWAPLVEITGSLYWGPVGLSQKKWNFPVSISPQMFTLTLLCAEFSLDLCRSGTVPPLRIVRQGFFRVRDRMFTSLVDSTDTPVTVIYRPVRMGKYGGFRSSATHRVFRKSCFLPSRSPRRRGGWRSRRSSLSGYS